MTTRRPIQAANVWVMNDIAVAETNSGSSVAFVSANRIEYFLRLNGMDASADQLALEVNDARLAIVEERLKRRV